MWWRSLPIATLTLALCTCVGSVCCVFPYIPPCAQRENGSLQRSSQVEYWLFRHQEVAYNYESFRINCLQPSLCVQTLGTWWWPLRPPIPSWLSWQPAKRGRELIITYHVYDHIYPPLRIQRSLGTQLSLLGWVESEHVLCCAESRTALYWSVCIYVAIQQLVSYWNMC